ncbi:MAG: DNA recombination protein RmuC, partial [Pseudomonadota bacterium]
MTLTDDTLVYLLGVAGAVALLVIILLILALRAAGRSAQMAGPLAEQLMHLNQRVQLIGDGQQQLAGGLTHVSEAQAAQQTNMIKLMEARLAAVQQQMNINLQTSAKT